jgi:all-trans-8'-apo-beta-carotenal 15,15'-oxygenase
MTPVDRAYVRNLVREHGFEPLAVEGRLPDLRGTLYRVGPGLFDCFGRRYEHLFEGDGAVTAIRLARGEARGAARLLDTDALLEERSAGRALYGFHAPWWRRMINAHTGRIKNTANTNVVRWQSELLALVESSRPTRIDPERLTVRGETDLGALLGPLSAHPHRVPARRASYGYGVRYGRKTKLDLYQLPDEGPARHLTTIELKQGPMLHDFMATENHLVFFVPPAVVSVPHALLQLGAFEDLFQWRPELGTLVLIVPIDRPDEPIELKTDAFFQWHFANGFERDGRLYVDFLHHRDFESFRSIGRNELSEHEGTYHRAVIDPAAKSIRMEEVFGVPADFPRVHPAVEASRHRYVWLVTREPPQRLVRLDVESGKEESFAFSRDERAAEAVVVPSGPAELDGFALTMVYDGARDQSALVVFDAKSLGEPVARAWFDHPVPITFHGNWVQS